MVVEGGGAVGVGVDELEEGLVGLVAEGEGVVDDGVGAFGVAFCAHPLGEAGYGGDEDCVAVGVVLVLPWLS